MLHFIQRGFLSGVVFLCLVSAVLAEPHTVKATSRDGTIVDAFPGQVIVRYKDGRSEQGRAAAMSMGGSPSMSPSQNRRLERIRVPHDKSVDEFIQQLSEDSNIEYVEPNIPVRAQAIFSPNDSLYSAQWYLDENHINIPSVWGELTLGSSSTLVAIIDSGISDNNPDISTGTLGYQFDLDLNGDGDCLDSGEFCESPNPIDNGSSAHGTRNAGLIAANINNATLIAGIAPNCRFMPLRILNEKGAGDSLGVALAIDYAVANGADVINMSLGAAGLSQAVSEAVANALAQDIILVASTGNNGSAIMYPAAIEGVIAVGSVDEDDVISSFSRRGPQIDLVAPGSDILSLDQTSASLDSGTSFAAPMVSAVVALMKSVKPSLSVAQVTRYLNYYADDVGPSGFDTTYGFGRLNALRSMQAVVSNETFHSIPTEGETTFPYPNPYNPTLGQNVSFNLPQSLGQTSVKITIFNMSGEPVHEMSFPDNIMEVQWNGRAASGQFLASGLYYYVVETSQGDATGKLTVMK